jgi:hypothetical protein
VNLMIQLYPNHFRQSRLNVAMLATDYWSNKQYILVEIKYLQNGK